MRNEWRRAWLVVLPSLGGLLGVLVDEQRHLGFTNWRAACRAAGPSLRSLIVFTRELLPSAIVGMLGGALIVVLIGAAARRIDAARGCFAAHLGCFAAMPLMLFVCAFAPSPAVMLVADVALAALFATLFLRLTTGRQRTSPAHP
jgi:hypothetical protein